MLVAAFLGTNACQNKSVSDAVQAPAAEFLLAAGDSTYWIRSGPDGLRVRSAPILLTQASGQFYELFISDDVHDYDDASFASAKAYSRDIRLPDSLLIFSDQRVQREVAAWQRAHPDAAPLDPEDANSGDQPRTVVSDDIEVIDVHGPYLSYDFSLDVDVAGQKQHEHRRRRGVLDLRSGDAASLRALLGEIEAQRVLSDARQAFAVLQDSVRHSTDARGALARRTLASFVFDTMSFAITDHAQKPAIAFAVSGVGSEGEALTLHLPPIATEAPSWWAPVRPTLPEWNADSTRLRWPRTDYEITAAPDSDSDALTIVLRRKVRGGASQAWPVATVASPVYGLISLDVSPIDSAMRTALARAFDRSRALGALAHQARRLFAAPKRKLHSTTFRACPFPARPRAMHTRQFASRTFGATLSACLH
ncbi:MAG: hypothetical protein M3Y64_06955 [Gemmatimonadota bacterium]|nr:hypothetical protein [Gemmatimonadota bacterium]